MARATVTRPLLFSLHPARSTGTALAPGLLTAAKALFITSTLQGYVHRLPDPFLPFIAGFDALPYREHLSTILQVVVVSAGAALLLNRAVRASCLVLGLAYGVALLSSRVYYLNATVFLMCMFVLIGLYERPWGLRLVRWQLVIMYAGSVVNKLFEADWRSGQYFEHWMHEIIASSSYAAAAAALPPLWLSWALGWTTIVCEAFIAVALAIPALQAAGAVTAFVFQTATWLMTGKTFGIFYSIVVLSLPIFACWPTRVCLRFDASSSTARAARRLCRTLDVDDRFDLRPAASRRAALSTTEELDHVGGWRALALWALYTPAVHLFAAVMLAMPALLRYAWPW